MRHVATFGMALAWALVASSARADVVGPDPSSCPAGGTPASCHGGPFCAVTECAGDADCTLNGTTCREVSVCIGKIGCAGLIGPGEDAAAYDRPTVESSCEQGASCGNGASCEKKRLCAPREPASSPARKQDAKEDCAVRSPGAPRRAAPAAALGLGLLALALARVRRR